MTAEAIDFKCPQGHALRAPTSTIGKKIRCPKKGCGVEVVVPPVGETLAQRPAAPMPANQPHQSPPVVPAPSGHAVTVPVQPVTASPRTPLWQWCVLGGVALGFVGLLVLLAVFGRRPGAEVASDSKMLRSTAPVPFGPVVASPTTEHNPLAVAEQNVKDPVVQIKRSPEPLKPFSPLKSSIRTLRLSPKEQLIGAGGTDEIVVWEASTGELRCTISGVPGGVRSLAFSPDERVLVSASYGRGEGDGPPTKGVIAWQLPDGKEIGRFEIGDEVVNHVDISSAGKHLVTAGQTRGESFRATGIVTLWDLNTRVALKSETRTCENGMYGVRFAPRDDAILAIFSLSPTLLLDNELKQIGEPLKVSNPSSPTFSTQGRMAICAGGDLFNAVGWVDVFQRDSLERELTIKTRSPELAEFSPDGNLLLIAGGSAVRGLTIQTTSGIVAPRDYAFVSIVDLVRKEQKELHFERDALPVEAACWLPGGNKCMFAIDNEVRLVDVGKEGWTTLETLDRTK